MSEFCTNYVEDIPNVAGLASELELWERMWREKNERGEKIPKKITETLKVVDPLSSPNVFAIFATPHNNSYDILFR